MTKILTRALNKVAAVEQQITAGTGNTLSTTYGNTFVTRVTVGAFTQAVAAAKLGFGKLLCTLPKGNIFIHAVYLDLTYVSSVANTVQADIGVGTVIASGAVDVLGGTATFENCLDGQTATAFNGTTPVNYEIAQVGEVDIKDGASTAKSLYLNIAGNFGAVTGNLTYSGTVSFVWSIVNV